MTEYKLYNEEFTPETLEYLTKYDGFTITNEEILSRLDLRNIRRVLTIDPKDAKDLDDAISIQQT